MLDSTSGQLEPTDAEQTEVEKEGITERTFGILLIVVGSITAAGTAVFNRSLQKIDYSVVMAYHGLVGFTVALLLLVFDQLVFSRTIGIKSLDNGLYDSSLLSLGATIDALSVFMQTIAFQKSASGFVGLMSFINIVYAMLTDFFVFNESL